MAWGLLRRAQGFVQKWPEGFRGYRAAIPWDAADGVAEGAVVVACGGSPWSSSTRRLAALILARLLDLVDERTPRFFKDGDGRFAVLADGDPDGGQ